ncbi:MAG: methylmalonyl Co-A mutase-associated GTPase MeaB [Bacteroidales bacterium]|jgi:LAO/AO transport system kinase|nr:methylmalonyl Co-A mutase-associated GTPase MeaB [Bacteroidales bacterium]MBQ1218354.1 methylmalonyl Co-A mutase-associated GTPase MeaB [Bacteroidales bacterium]MBQ1929723.1 methylmalonyl Co-A mutase-associated GTPase MeaB [Bacteroidales bacterium]MBQ5783450.1 methylmalonyl Co-A mutase-associated GTPase MeaB [Bacteroidales bacterium]
MSATTGEWPPKEHENPDTALVVNEGVEQPPIINPYIKNFFKKKPRTLSVEEYMEGITSGNRTILSQAITLVESSLPAHREIAQQIIAKCQEYCTLNKIETMRIGITGVPGAGKSTFIEAFGGLVTSKGHKLAVLAIDPSSEKTKGSILGDKTRMETLCNDPNAFIRPSPSAGSLGGVARKTRETVLLCEAAGYDVVFIETVGVGQSETAVHSMSDFFLLLMLSGAGDDLQGIKRGIMEMSDLIAITKADGTNVDKATMARALYANALHLFPPTESTWVPTALTSSAVTKAGLDAILEKIEEYFNLVKGNGYYKKKRREQAQFWMYESINESLKNNFYENPVIEEELKKYEESVLSGKLDSFMAAQELLQMYKELGK